MYDNLPEGWKDAIHVETIIDFDWMDRLKIFLGQRVTVHTRTLTEHLPGKSETDYVRVSVFNHRRKPKMQMGVVTMEIPNDPQ